jgi:ribosomal protein L37AE/L43A
MFIYFLISKKKYFIFLFIKTSLQAKNKKLKYFFLEIRRQIKSYQIICIKLSFQTNFKMSQDNMCPICMDDMVRTCNFTVTECGHCFHTSCLMRNVLHNSFACPYCRKEMVEQLEEEPEDEEEDDISYITNEENETYRDEAFTGMRMLFQRVERDNREEAQEEEHEQEEQQQEQEQEPEQEPEHQAEQEELVESLPSFEKIMRKLIGKRVTYEDFVKYALLEHDEFSYNEEFEASSDKIFGIIRMNISNHNPETPEPEPRFRNIFTTSPMPDFTALSREEIKIICRDYNIRYRSSRFQSEFERIWISHNHNNIQT